jgi:hypothetical protein
MRTFKDANGKDWVLAVNVTTRQKVRSDASFDVFGVVDKVEIEKLEDPATLVMVIFSLCEDQAKTDGVSAEQFAAAMVGDVLDSASDALFGAIADFFPKSRRSVMTAALEKGKQLQEAARNQALARIAAVTVESLLPPASSAAATSSPASSGSTSTAQT